MLDVRVSDVLVGYEEVTEPLENRYDHVEESLATGQYMADVYGCHVLDTPL